MPILARQRPEPAKEVEQRGKSVVARRSLCVAMLLAAFGVAACKGPGPAADTLKLAVGQRGNWENAAPYLGTKAGIFAKHGIVLDVLYTEGGGETMQAVLSNSVDVGIGVGTLGVISAFAKGAPVRAIANSTTGANDLFWYVPSRSSIKTMGDVAGKTIAYSSNGSSTNVAVLGLMRTFNVHATPVATGSPAATFTQTMSGQIDVGWSSPPFGLDSLEKGQIRIVARGSDVPSLRNQTVRVMVTSVPILDRKRALIKQFMNAYAETLDWMYSDPAAITAYATWVGVPENVARGVRDNFYPKENLRVNRLSGMDEAMKDAANLKFITQPLSKEQMDTLFQYVPPPSQ